MGKWVHRVIEIDEATKTGTCTNCGPVRLYHRPDGRWTCWVAKAKHHGPERRTNRVNLNRGRIGITDDDVRQALEDQDYQCLICQAELTVETAGVDHCHRTGIYRGLLCSSCNTGLGLLGDTPAALRRALDYLLDAHR